MPKQQENKGKRPGGRSSRIRAKVLESAFRLLTDEGPAAFSVGAVAARAGVNETSIYRRWGTKSNLALDACLNFAAERLPLPDTGALRSDLIELLRRVSELLQSPEGKALLAMSFALEAESLEIRKAYWRVRLAAAALLVERAVARGEVDASLEGEQIIEALIAPFFFRALVSLDPVEGWPFEKMVDRMLGPNSSRYPK
jgi:AcrR family transcriptional regulator